MRLLSFKSVGLGFIFISGLVSCAPENNRAQETYRSATPKIIFADHQTPASDLRAFEKLPTRSLDLQDEIDASEGYPARAQVRSVCRLSSADLQQKTDLSTGKFSVFQIIPEKLLAADLNQTPVECSFEIILFNAQNSRHIFQLANIFLTDKLEHPVHLTRNLMGQREKPFRIQNENLQEIRIRFENPEGEKVKIACDEVDFEERTFLRVQEFADFNLHAFHTRIGTEPAVSRVHPLQKCRVLIKKQNRTIALSPQFELLLPRQPLAIQSQGSPRANEPSETAATTEPLLKFLRKNQPLILSQYTFHNSEPLGRWVRIPRKPAKTRLHFLFGNKKGQIYRMSYFMELLTYAVHDREPVFEDDQSRIYFIEGRSDLSVTAEIISPGQMRCAGRLYNLGSMMGMSVEIDPLETVSEVDSGGKFLEALKLQPAEGGVFSIDSGFYKDSSSMNLAKDTHTCGWI